MEDLSVFTRQNYPNQEHDKNDRAREANESDNEATHSETRNRNYEAARGEYPVDNHAR